MEGYENEGEDFKLIHLTDWEPVEVGEDTGDRSKLASLFGMDQASTGQGNESFQYTAPKQPKKGTPPPGAGSQKPTAGAVPPAVLFATGVHAYQYLNGQYMNQGKLGVAILGNHASTEYKILLYASQQKRIAAARIYPTFTFTVQANNYCVFYDDQRQNWSVMFDSEKAVVEFGKQVCLAKCNSASMLESVLIQDLAPGDGQAVETGDSLEVSYTGWLYQNHAFGQVFDTNVNRDKLLRLKIGSGKVIKGWEVGMLGMKKNGKRLLIIPPSLAYGTQGIPNRIPPDATLVFEVEVKRVKFSKESGFDKQSTRSHDSAASSPAPSIESLAMETSIPAPVSVPPKPGEHVVRAKSNSLSDMLANPDTTKAKLISRMAKMGQPMPFLTGAHSAQPDSSDSELEDHSLRVAPLAAPSPAPSSVQHTAHPVHNLPPQQPAPVPVSMHPSSSAALMPVTMSAQQGLPGSGQSFQPYTGISYGYPQGHAAQTQIQTVAPMFPAQTQQYQAAGDVTSFMMTEARQHNTEIRLAISKASDKIDQLSHKVEDLQKHVSGPSLFPGISSVTMETSMIMHNIQRIIQENERLKQEVFDKSSRIEEQNGKISDLIQRNQRYVEQSNLLMEQRNDTLISSTENNQARILFAEQEKVKVTEELAVATSQVAKLQLELTAHQKEEMELRSQLASALQEAEGQRLRLNNVEAQLTELQEVSERAQTRCKAEKQSRKELEVKVVSLEEELIDLRAEKENLEKSLAERKRKAGMERQRAEEEMDEIRKSYEEELEKVRSLLKKTRTSTDQAAAEQIVVMQAELESQWQVKCDRMLALAKEQHSQQYREVCEQREGQQLQISQLEAKLASLKQSRHVEEERVSSLQEQADELQTLKERSRAATMKEHYDSQISELQRQVSATNDTSHSGDTAEEVKKIMNGVFQSLRGEFDLDEMYNGRGVLSIIMNTIKVVTLQLLRSGQDQPIMKKDNEDEESEEEIEERAAPLIGSLSTKVNTSITEKPKSAALCEEHSTASEADQLNDVALSSGHSHEAIELKLDHAEARGSKATQLELEQAEAFLSPTQNIAIGRLDASVADSQEDAAGDLGKQTGEGETEKKVESPLSDLQSERPHHQSEVLEHERTLEKSLNLVDGAQHCESGNASVLNNSTASERQEEQSQTLSFESGDSSAGIQEEPRPSEPLHGKVPDLNGDEESPEIPEGPAFNPNETPSELETLHVTECGSNGTATTEELKSKSVSTPNPSSLFSDDDDDEGLFKPVTLKVEKMAKKEEEEEDEEEVSMKGCPPPAPLFGDEDEEDDFDWLG
ncbi:FK506-binding protein 15-like isoform X2 [Carcharodon carcharias]|uniref:FK506-binding protein 15-like isoform X2 n=1 Tax=Carcharodon carcharias TaxID=13397 RepID=UPI001B7E5228|nr:FK506-binding protein 15-like isoform X2 [Carcharodon carcharias]